MFGSLGNLANVLRQAQQISGKLGGMSEKLASLSTVATSGAGLVEIEINGLQEVQRCTIDPKLLEQNDLELLEDLIKGAVNQAIQASKALHMEAVKELTSGMQLPGLDEAIAKMS